MTDSKPPITDAPLYVLGVKAERFMFVDVMDVAVSTTGLTQFAGSNGNGKTDALTALEATLLGGSAIPNMPVQAGAEKAETEVTIGGIDGKPQFVARRTYRDGGKPSLVVRPVDGAALASPQGILDAIVEAKFLNPVKWASPNRGTQRADNEYRLEVLFGLCPLSIDLVAHDAAAKALSDELSPVNRRIKELNAVVTDAVACPAPDGPEEDETALVTELARIENGAELRARAKKRTDELGREIEEAEKEIARLQAKVKLLNEEWVKQGNLSVAKAADDPTPLRAKLAAVRERNVKRRTAVVDRTRAEERAKQLLAETTRKADIEGRLVTMEHKRENALKAAKFPLPNLTISSDGWLSVRKKDGSGTVPFHQENTAKRILAAFVIFAATKPKLRAFVITNGGNDLDHESMMMLAALSKRFAIPVFIERIIADAEAGAVIEFRGGAVVETRPAEVSP